MDPDRLKSSFGKVAAHGDEVPLYFYSYLFLRYPQVRPMFPPSMAAQRDRLVGALGRVVSQVDQIDSLIPFIEQLGRDHRKYQVQPDQYPAVGEALLATLAHFLGDDWTPELAQQWAAAYDVVAQVMIEAAAADEDRPAWWQGEVLEHEIRAPDVAVLTVRVDRPLQYLAGQSLSVESPARPRLWRHYSPANAPRSDNTIEFHVRAVDGGWVSSALVYGTGVGDVVNIGPPVGELTLAGSAEEDILMIASGTGLAPLRAMVEQIAAEQAAGRERQVHLFFGGRMAADLYDLPALDRLAAEHRWLHVVPVLERSDGLSVLGGPDLGTGERIAPPEIGLPADAAARRARWDGHDIYVCGSTRMVDYSRDALVNAGIDPSRLRYETFGQRRSDADADADAEAGRSARTPRHSADLPPDAQATRPTGVFVPGGEQA